MRKCLEFIFKIALFYQKCSKKNLARHTGLDSVSYGFYVRLLAFTKIQSHCDGCRTNKTAIFFPKCQNNNTTIGKNKLYMCVIYNFCFFFRGDVTQILVMYTSEICEKVLFFLGWMQFLRTIIRGQNVLISRKKWSFLNSIRKYLEFIFQISQFYQMCSQKNLAWHTGLDSVSYGFYVHLLTFTKIQSHCDGCRTNKTAIFPKCQNNNTTIEKNKLYMYVLYIISLFFSEGGSLKYWWCTHGQPKKYEKKGCFIECNSWES